MPTNFLKNLKRPVRLKTGETCSWRRHFRRGSAARSLWGHFEFLDSVKEAGFCFTGTVEGLRKHVKKFRNGKVVGTYSYDMVQNLLLDFRAAGLISMPFENDDGDFSGQIGFMVARQDLHDALCHREGRTCRYIGWKNLPPGIKLGKHHPDAAIFAAPGTQAGTTLITAPGTQAGTQDSEKWYPSGYPTKMPHVSQNEMVTAPPEKLGLQFGAPRQSSQVNEENQTSSKSIETHGQVQPENPKAKAGLTSSSSRPDLTKSSNQTRAETGISVGTHIGKPVTIKQVSDGEIDIDQVSTTNGAL